MSLVQIVGFKITKFEVRTDRDQVSSNSTQLDPMTRTNLISLAWVHWLYLGLPDSLTQLEKM